MASSTKNNPAPPDHSIVAPYLMVDNVEAQITFLQTVFDAEAGEALKDPQGIIQHGDVRIGDTNIMMGTSSERWPATRTMCYIFVADVDDTYKRALAAGATPVMEPDDRFYGHREGGVLDMHGNTWWIAQFLREVPMEEMERKLAEMYSKP